MATATDPFDLDDRRPRPVTPIDLELAAWCREVEGREVASASPLWRLPDDALECPYCSGAVTSDLPGGAPGWLCLDCGERIWGGGQGPDEREPGPKPARPGRARKASA